MMLNREKTSHYRWSKYMDHEANMHFFIGKSRQSFRISLIMLYAYKHN